MVMYNYFNSFYMLKSCYPKVILMVILECNKNPLSGSVNKTLLYLSMHIYCGMVNG